MRPVLEGLEWCPIAKKSSEIEEQSFEEESVRYGRRQESTRGYTKQKKVEKNTISCHNDDLNSKKIYPGR